MARNKEINERMKEERYERILAGALELFALNGLAGTKISDIARHTKMSNGLVYHYFSSKEDIFVELIRVAFERMVQACRFLESLPLEPHEKIKYAIAELVKTIRNKPESCLYHLLIAQATASKNVPRRARKLLDENRKIPYEIIAKIISQGQISGTIRKGCPEDLAFFFWININGIALHQAMYGKNARNTDVIPLYHIFFESVEINEDC